MGHFADAEPLYRRSLAIREKQLGPDLPVVSSSLLNLAALYGAMGRYAEAEPLYRRSLEIMEKRLGPDHPEVAKVLNNLAELHRAMGRGDDIESLHRRSLELREKQLGPDHPDVASSLPATWRPCTAWAVTPRRSRCTGAATWRSWRSGWGPITPRWPRA